MEAEPAECEVCKSLGAEERTADHAELHWLSDGWVALCAEHAAQARIGDMACVQDVRRRFREADGRRALLPRRSGERRAFPPRPEGRRKSTGRRRADFF